MIRSIQHVALQLPRVEDARAFYTALGLELVEQHGRLVARCEGRAQDQVIVTEGPRAQLHYVSFAGRAADMPATKQRLEARGIELLDPPFVGAPDGLWFRDPDRNLIHLGTEASAPPRSAQAVEINTSGAIVRPNVRGCPPFGLDPKPLRLAHIILFTPDPKAQAAFYCEALGMKLTDYVGDDFVYFLRGASDGDHHLLGLLKSHAPGLHHQSYEMDSLDHIAIGARRIGDAGYKHVWGTGRHTVGSNFFHFFRDPWGTLAEYTFDLDFIPEGAAWEARHWSKEQGLFLWSSDGPPPRDFPQNLMVPA
jgi:catechol 2,3-dioxygenase-like lactoylglutathione lyase family enzyme